MNMQSRVRGYDYINRQRSFFDIRETKPKLWLSANNGTGTSGARVFNPATLEYFILPSHTDPGVSDFWISVWLNIATDVLSALICNGAEANGSNGFTLFYMSGGIYLQLNDSVQATRVYAAPVTAGTISVGKWYHLVCNFDRDGSCIGYLNNVQKNSINISAHGATFVPFNYANTRIGYNFGAPTDMYYSGSMSKYGYGLGLLTTAEIAELYNQGNGKYYAELSLDLSNKVVHYWNLNESSGNAIDTKGVNDGNDTNTVTSGTSPREATASDSVGGFHGVLTDMQTVTSWSTDVPNIPTCIGGFSLTFDGADSYVLVGNVGNVTAIEFWIKSLQANQSIMTLANTALTDISVIAGTLTFGGSISVSAISVDDVSKTAAQAGALINDGTWHKISLALTSIAASNLRFGILSTISVGNIRLDYTSINGGSSLWRFDDGPQLGEASDGDPICVWESKEGSRYQGLQETTSLRPTYIRGAINGQPAIDFDGVDDVLEFIDAIGVSTGAGHFMIVCSQDANKLATFFGQADEAVATRFFELGTSAAGFLSYNQNDAGTVDTLTGNSALGTSYKILEVSSNGTLVAMKVNQVVQTITVAAGGNNGDWAGDVTGPDNTMLGALKTTAVSKYFAGRIAELIYWDTALSSNDANAVRIELANKYGIVLV